MNVKLAIYMTGTVQIILQWTINMFHDGIMFASSVHWKANFCVHMHMACICCHISTSATLFSVKYLCSSMLLKSVNAWFSEDGGWCPWKPEGTCSKTCGGGIIWKRRKCECPAPGNGGKPCPGPQSKYWPCNEDPCPRKLVMNDTVYNKWCIMRYMTWTFSILFSTSI